MVHSIKRHTANLLVLALVVAGGITAAFAFLTLAKNSSTVGYAAPIDPPAGYPKFNLSTMTASPTLAAIGGAKVTYTIKIVNTGAYAGYGVAMSDVIPANTTYNGDAKASVPPAPVYNNGVLTWLGTVGFDGDVSITFSVNVLPAYEGVISNTASISHSSMPKPVLVSAETIVTNDPFFQIEKSSSPEIPGPGRPLTYTISVTNLGQAAAGLPITVTDKLPQNTTFLSVGQDGAYNPVNKTVNWVRTVNLQNGETSRFTYNVTVGNVVSGTVISNVDYRVKDGLGGLSTGQVYTVTVLDPILFLYKETDPFPPGSNREMTYTLTVLNKGSLATDLVISDKIPSGVTYLRGGKRSGDTVSWNIPSLDTGESARVSFTVYVGDAAEIPILNNTYKVCSGSLCQAGVPLTSIAKGPVFEVSAELDPIAKKPGGGGGPVTPTLTVSNLGPGNAIDANALLLFDRISVSMNDLVAIPNFGKFSVGPICGDKCVSYLWKGDLNVGEGITFTVLEGQSTIGGEEGTVNTATVVATDSLGAFTTQPVTATATGKVTHFANLIPTKSAPPVIGAGQTMTYTIQVFDSGLSTDVPPYPVLTDTVPAGTTLAHVGDGGTSHTVGSQTVVSWTLPAMGPGDVFNRSYSVVVDSDLISGTKIVNDDYRTSWFNINTITSTMTLSNTGVPITTVVKEVGLIDSFKTVSPTTVLPGPSDVLTYVVHVVNSSPMPLEGVSLYDQLPWQSSTYQRDAVASSGQVISDIVSVGWTGNVAPFSSESITLTVLVDPYYKGPITNTAVISHSSLLNDVVVKAVAYVTDEPVLRISKKASPDPVRIGGELLYTLRVANLGQQATELVVTDTIPANTVFVPYSASGNGQWLLDQVRWEFPVLLAGEERVLSFRVKVKGGQEVVNDHYGVTCAEGVSDQGDPVITPVTGGGRVYLPIVHK